MKSSIYIYITDETNLMAYYIRRYNIYTTTKHCCKKKKNNERSPGIQKAFEPKCATSTSIVTRVFFFLRLFFSLEEALLHSTQTLILGGILKKFSRMKPNQSRGLHIICTYVCIRRRNVVARRKKKTDENSDEFGLYIKVGPNIQKLFQPRCTTSTSAA